LELIDEDFLHHELEESVPILGWVDGRDEGLVPAKDVDLQEGLQLLLQVEALQVVNDPHVIYVGAVRTQELVPAPFEVSDILSPFVAVGPT